MTVLKAELRSINNICTCVFFYSRCAKHSRSAEVMESSVERFRLYVNWKGSSEGADWTLWFLTRFKVFGCDGGWSYGGVDFEA